MRGRTVLSLTACFSNSDGESTGIAKKASAAVTGLKMELKQLLAKPLLARGVSAKYITSGARAIAHELVTGDRKLVSLCS